MPIILTKSFVISELIKTKSSKKLTILELREDIKLEIILFIALTKAFVITDSLI